MLCFPFRGVPLLLPYVVVPVPVVYSPSHLPICTTPVYILQAANQDLALVSLVLLYYYYHNATIYTMDLGTNYRKTIHCLSYATARITTRISRHEPLEYRRVPYRNSVHVWFGRCSGRVGDTQGVVRYTSILVVYHNSILYSQYIYYSIVC